MSDLRPILLDDPVSPLGKLLRSAETDAPAPNGKAQLLAALSTSSVVAAPLLGVGKWLALGGIATATAIGGAKWLPGYTHAARPAVTHVAQVPLVFPSKVSREPQPLVPQEPAAPPAENVERPGSLSGTSAAPPIESRSGNHSLSRPGRGEREKPIAVPAAKAEPDSPLEAAPSSSGESALAAEVASLDGVRKLLDAGNGNAALAALDLHVASFLDPRLVQESVLLRVEILKALGRLDEARAVAEGLLHDFPESTHARRIRTLLGEP